MTVHLVNLTNPMMMKGPYRELISGGNVNKKVEGETISLTIPQILDHEIIAIDLVS